MKNLMRVIAVLGVVGAAVMLSRAYAPPILLAQGENKPLVIINSPFSNATFKAGEDVVINSTSTDAAGIIKVELLVDNKVIATNPTPNNQPQVQYRLIQRWTATEGTHTVTVRATNTKSEQGEAAIIVIATPAGTVTPTTVTPTTPVAITATPEASSCILSSKFIKDVTIPDGTTVAPGAAFVKTWQIQNNGTCVWDSTFTIVFVGGAGMNAPSPAPIPPTAPGAIAQISQNFVAPTIPGTYQSVWEVSAPNGVHFAQSFWVLIKVPGAPTPVPPTAVPPTAVPPTAVPPPQGCQGSPFLTQGPYGPLPFGADRYQLTQGQSTRIYWGKVNNADAAVLWNSVTGQAPIGTPGQQNVHPNQTSQYTLKAWCKGHQVDLASFTINVQSKPPPEPQGSVKVTSAVPRGATAYNVSVTYTWNGIGAPANIQIVGGDAQDKPVSATISTPIQKPGGSFTRSVVVLLGAGKVRYFQACIFLYNNQQTFKCNQYYLK